MKNLILILGILIGLTIGVSAQNTEQEARDSLYFSPPTTEEEATDLTEYLEEYLNSSSFEPQKFPNQPVSLNFDKIDKIHPKSPLNEKIKNLFLSLNNSSSPDNIANLIDSLYVRSGYNDEMCLDICHEAFCDGNIRLVYDQLKGAILNDLYYKEIRVSVKSEILLSTSDGYSDEYSNPLYNDYWLDFNISIDGKVKGFNMVIFNGKIAQISWCGEFIEY